MHIVIMGCGRVGASLARSLERRGHSVAVIDIVQDAFRRLGPEFQGKTVKGVGFDRQVLVRAGIERADGFAAVSSGDNSNILAARVVRETFEVHNVVARIYDQGRAEVYERLGIPSVATVRWAADQVLRRLLPEQAMAGDFREASGRLLLGELNLHDSWAGHALTDIERFAGVRIAYITRFGEGLLPGPDTSYQQGDTVHAMMGTEDINDIARILSQPPASDAESDLSWK